MFKRCFVLLGAVIIALLCFNSARAQSGSNYSVFIDGKNTSYTLNLGYSGGKASGKYVNSFDGNNSTFTGTLCAGRGGGKVLSLVQYDSRSNYYAAYSGHMQSNTIRGTWVDVDGNQGTFEFRRE